MPESIIEDALARIHSDLKTIPVSLSIAHNAKCIAQANGEIDLCGRPMRTDTPEQIFGRRTHEDDGDFHIFGKHCYFPISRVHIVAHIFT